MGVNARIVEDVDGLAPVRAEWDELAVAAERPFAAPAWVLAWWEHMRPATARLQVVLAERDGELVGIAPLYGVGRLTRPIGAALAPVEPLSRAGLEAEVAAAAAERLAAVEPRIRQIELVEHGSGSSWAELLSRGWTGGRRAWQWVESEAPAPQVDFGDGMEAWMMGKSKSFRRDIRSSRRKLDKAGAEFRLATEATLEADVREFIRLHRMRFASSGGSSLPEGDGIERMLAAVGRELLPRERFKLICLDLGDETIAADLVVIAGGEVSAWNGGFDETYSDFSPGMQCLIHGLTEAAERGERTMSLGPGGQAYKYRLSTSEDCLRSIVILPRGASYPLARLRLAPRQARRALAGRLSPEVKRRLRRLGVS